MYSSEGGMRMSEKKQTFFMTKEIFKKSKVILFEKEGAHLAVLT